jgi:phospholipid/cholesterol/gamma-HCH transport system permease protein
VPKRFRAGDFFRTCELAGADALGIIALLGFLFGLIMAFSSAMPLRQFGVEVYVSDLVAIALVRVLGPFITAIVVAGRTGSAFAAEIGTMKINNELDALNVMNLDPAVFLVLPRVTATLLMTPLLAVVTNIAGLIGSGLVIMSLGYPLITYTTHVQDILDLSDVGVGLFKTLVFGGMIGAVGCLRGLQAKSGPGAVGIATTRAVVTAIVLLVVLEGIFSVLLYFMDI